MQSQIVIVDQEPLLKSIKRVEEGHDALISIPATCFELKAYAVDPPIGFRYPAKFPYCCEYHTDMLNRALEFYDNFPDCCERHRKLLHAKWFRKIDYTYVPFKVISLVSFLHDKVCEFAFHPNWQKELSDYIEYSVKSFGALPEGYGSPVGIGFYLSAAASLIEQHPLLIERQKSELLKCLESDAGELKNPSDMNLLYKLYKDWMKLFPFELPLFQHLKAHFDKNIPILQGPGSTNHYSGMTCFKLKTREELKELLIGMTRYLLNEINSAKLFEEGLLLETEKLKLDVVMAQRRIRLEEDVLAPVSDKHDFIRLLDKWLGDEKEFLKDIKEEVYKKSPMQFIHDLLQGMHLLQREGVKQYCIRNIRENGRDKEFEVRSWFRNWFAGRYPDAAVTAEEQQGNGHMDLRIARQGSMDKIIEFKGWWNSDKTDTPHQICSYLTDFQKEGYIVMINHLKRGEIDAKYKSIASSTIMNYVPDTWAIYQYQQTDVSFYQSRHQFDGKTKTIYHFILNVYF